MTESTRPLYLGGKPTTTDAVLPVFDKYTGATIASVALADRNTIDKAIQSAVDTAPQMAELSGFDRQKILHFCIARFRERSEELAQLLCAEAGKPIKDSRGEVGRLIDTFSVAAEETVQIDGEIIALDRTERTRNYLGFVRRFPIGPCSFISPFNFPLNLTAHKIAPAIAAGCPFVLKPASYTPLGALVIAEILEQSPMPKGGFSILPCKRADADLFCSDDRLKLLSFTGSPEVGWELKAKAGKKKVILELGGNAGCIVDHDTDLDDALERIIFGAFYQSGQSCISVQRIIVHASIYDRFKEMLTSRAKILPCGDPRDETTFIGPLISENDARRLIDWIEEAVDLGGTLLCGGQRENAILRPTLLENVPRKAKIYAREAFGPVAVLSRFDHFDDALGEINDSIYGLQAGVFTNNLHHADKAWNTLEVGGVIIGDIPSFRVDHMPYGGVKESGAGREGVKYAIEDMTEPRLMVWRTGSRRK